MPFDESGSMQGFDEDSDLPVLGLAARIDHRKLKSGETVTGLLVVSVSAGGPAASAGVKGFEHKIASTLEGVAMAAAMVFPPAAPAAILVPVIESSHLGEHYDLITAVDGYRVTSTLDLEDSMRDVRPGETIYLSLVRDGARMQLPVALPVSAAPQTPQ
jgi:S1-C subfamily serine protease